jgi:hypothetical protein
LGPGVFFFPKRAVVVDADAVADDRDGWWWGRRRSIDGRWVDVNASQRQLLPTIEDNARRIAAPEESFGVRGSG